MLNKLASNVPYNLMLISLALSIPAVAAFCIIKNTLLGGRSRPSLLPVFWVLLMSFSFSLFILYLLQIGLSALFEISDHVRTTIPDEKTWVRMLVPAITISAWAVFLISWGQVAKSRLTNRRRVIVLTLCLLPTALAILVLLVEPNLSSWPILSLALKSSLPCWIMNIPALFLGKTFGETVMRVLYHFQLLP